MPPGAGAAHATFIAYQMKTWALFIPQLFRKLLMLLMQSICCGQENSQ